jgi:O-antigen/teichoic acid export membrane protein
MPRVTHGVAENFVVENDLQIDAVEKASRAPTSVEVRRSTLRSSTTWMLAGNILLMGMRWAIVPLLAKFTTTATVGQFGWAVAVCLPTITFCRFGLRILQTTDARDEITFSDYLGFSILSTLVALAIIGGLAAFNGYNAQTMILVLAVGIWNAVESISDAFAGLFQRRERMDLVAKSYILQALAMGALVTLALATTQEMLLAIAALIAAGVLRLVTFELPLAKRLLRASVPGFVPGNTRLPHSSPLTIWPRLSWQGFKRIVVFGAPLAVVTLLMAYMTSVPRYILKDALGDAPLGIFVALFALANVQTMITLSVSQSLSSRLAISYVKKHLVEFRRLVLKASLFAATLGILGLIISLGCGKWLLAVIYKPEYAAEISTFQILLLAGMVAALGNIVGTAVTSMRRFYAQVPLHFLKLVILYFGCRWGVDYYGLEGVAWAIVAASAFGVIGNAWLVIRRLSATVANDKV